MSNNLTGAVIQPIATFIAKAIIRVEYSESISMNSRLIKGYIYNILGTYPLVSTEEEERFVSLIEETYDFQKRIELLDIENININRSTYYMMKNNHTLFNNEDDEIINPLLDDILIMELDNLIA